MRESDGGKKSINKQLRHKKKGIRDPNRTPDRKKGKRMRQDKREESVREVDRDDAWGGSVTGTLCDSDWNDGSGVCEN